MDELILLPPPTPWICGLVPKGKRAIPSTSNLWIESGVTRLLLDRESQGKLSLENHPFLQGKPSFQPGGAKMWKHQTRGGFYSSDNHRHHKHFHSCCFSPGQLWILALPRSEMNFQGPASALLWLSGVRWNSSAMLLVAFSCLF